MLKSLSLSVPILLLAGSFAFADSSATKDDHPTSSLATSNHWLASDVYKAAVYDPSNHKIGDVDDLVMDSSGQIKTAVVGVGGFLGIGQKDVAVPFTDLKAVSHNGTEELMLDRTKAQLQQAPAYKKTAEK